MKKEMRKFIFGKTLLFVGILAYVILFKTIFGEDNILIAVMSVTGMLMYMGRDLTGELLKYTFKFIGFYLLIGIGTFIASGNMWIAIFINFAIVFFISYSFGHVLKNAMYLPFTLLYLFLLAYPVTVHALPMRLIALVVGALVIVAPQLLINKNKVPKASSKIINGLFDLLDKKIEFVLEEKKTKELDAQINGMMTSLKNIIYDKKEKKFYISAEGRGYLDILASLDKLNHLMVNGTLDEKALNDIKKGISEVKALFNKEENNVTEYVKEIKENYKNSVSISNIQGIGSIILLIDTLKNLEQKKTVKTNIIKGIKEDAYGLKNIKFNSVRISYALHVAIEVAIGCFIMDYFHLHQGRWIMYTVLSLTNPILEVTKNKAKDRVIATIIGAVFIGIVFSFIKNPTIRTLVVLGAGYANVYCVTYAQKMITVTMSAVGAAIMANEAYVGVGHIVTNPVLLALQRIGLILLGVIIALIINRFFFRYDVKKVNDNLEGVSRNLTRDLISNLDKILSGEKLDDYINNVYILMTQVNETIKTNMKIVKKNDLNENEEHILSRRLSLVAMVYELNKFINNEKISEEKRIKLENVIVELNIENKKKKDEIINEGIQWAKFESVEEKVVVSFLVQIKREYKSII
ncbi:MAG: FUSC family protein [Clostridium sp.]|uniref:FUSC family protein n=1 Tax=Clostridium sp. TaxID=1506 RepID=UPI003F325F16